MDRNRLLLLQQSSYNKSPKEALTAVAMTPMTNYDSPPRRSVAESLLEAHNDESATYSPTSTAEIEIVEFESYRLSMMRKLAEEHNKVTRHMSRSKADSFAQQARYLREEAQASDAVNHLEGSLQRACDRAIACRMDMAKLQEAEEIKYVKFEVKVLNLKIWESLLRDPDCRDIYAQTMNLRVRPFGDFSNVASSVTEWVKLRQKLEWVEKVLVMSQFKETNPIEDEQSITKILKKKADAIHRYNCLNDIIFVGE
jgi:hypothetical protein